MLQSGRIILVLWQATSLLAICILCFQPINSPMLDSTSSDISMHERPSVLIVDDDPMHLRIYGWIVEAAGFRALFGEVRFDGVDIPEAAADAVLLDYHLGGRLTNAVDVAKLIQSRFPDVPIVVLSEQICLPEDIAPLVQGFVRKGDPAKLVDKLKELLCRPDI
jgi:CheY-like chemotaxis protein